MGSKATYAKYSELMLYERSNLDELIAKSETEYLEILCELIECFYGKESNRLNHISKKISPSGVIQNLSSYKEGEIEGGKELKQFLI